MANSYYRALSHVVTYGKFRPTPPDNLIKEIVNFLQEKAVAPFETAVDIGCGSGQSTNLLSTYFKNVVGLDPSSDIIKQAKENKLSNVNFIVSPAEQLPFENGTVDLVTTAQAVHWFDLAKFYPEVERVLKRDGVLAIYGYNLPEPVDVNRGAGAADIVRKYYEKVLGDYVLEGSRKTYLENYKGKEFNNISFIENGLMIRKEGFKTSITANVNDVTGYISSWSGFQNYVAQKGEEAGDHLLQRFQQELSSVLGKSSDETFTVEYRYFLLMGRKL